MSVIKASDVIDMLRRHYLPEGRPAGGIFAPEIGSPCGKRRADLLWMPTTIAGGRGLVGHEVKVSRADVLTELADPAKADPWARYCDRWWLVVADPALVEGVDIPEAWGIMSPPSGRRTRSMTVVRPAPKLSPIDRSPGVERLATWMLHQHIAEESRLRMDRDYQKSEATRLRSEIAGLRAGGARQESPHAARLSRIMAAIHEQGQSEGIWGGVDEDAVVRAVLDLEHARAAASELRGSIERLLSNMADPFRYTREHLLKASKDANALPVGRTGRRAS